MPATVFINKINQTRTPDMRMHRVESSFECKYLYIGRTGKNIFTTHTDRSYEPKTFRNFFTTVAELRYIAVRYATPARGNIF